MLRKKRWAFAGRLTIASEQVYASATTEASICPRSSREPSPPEVQCVVLSVLSSRNSRPARLSRRQLIHGRSAIPTMMARSCRSWISMFSRLARTNLKTNTRYALTAADAVFGEGSPVAPLPKASPLSNAPVGRVLPSYIGEDDLLTVRLTEGDGKSRSGRSVGKVKSSSPIRLKKPTLQPESEVAGGFLERPATSFSPDILIVSTPHRDRRSIQKRWVLRTELKAGEKWKRRLCKAAR